MPVTSTRAPSSRGGPAEARSTRGRNQRKTPCQVWGQRFSHRRNAAPRPGARSSTPGCHTSEFSRHTDTNSAPCVPRKEEGCGTAVHGGTLGIPAPLRRSAAEGQHSPARPVHAHRERGGTPASKQHKAGIQPALRGPRERALKRVLEGAPPPPRKRPCRGVQHVARHGRAGMEATQPPTPRGSDPGETLSGEPTRHQKGRQPDRQDCKLASM